jgi:hypothetical protein
VPEPQYDQGDPELHKLFEQFDGHLVSPGGAAALLGLSRKTIYTLGQREKIRVFHSSKKDRLSESGAKWTYIPVVDLAAYAKQVGRPFPKGPWDKA